MESTLVGATDSAPVKSTDHNPCGSTKPPKGAKTTLKQVSYSNCDRDPKQTGPQFRGDIGGK